MNKQSNGYIIMYATILVVVVAVALSFTAIKLQPLQQANVETEKKGAILGSVGLLGDPDKAADKNLYVAEQYAKYITESFLVNSKGEKVEGNAFEVLNSLKAEYEKPAEERTLPLFVSRDDQGVLHYIIPTWGVGLWGPVWGYVALDGDWNTIFGVVFDHKSETPGLGAEIATPAFEDQYVGKTIFEGPDFVGIAVTKGAGSSQGNQHAVDAITGGTITSRAVEKMVIGCLKDYQAFFVKERAALVAPELPAVDSTLNTVDSTQVQQNVNQPAN